MFVRWVFVVAVAAAEEYQFQIGDCPRFKLYPLVKLQKDQHLLGNHKNIGSSEECGQHCLHTVGCRVYQHSPDNTCKLAGANYPISGNGNHLIQLFVPDELEVHDKTCDGLLDQGDFDCQAIKSRNPNSKTGRYVIKTKTGPGLCVADSKCCATATCFMDDHGGHHWTVVQQRTNEKETFDKSLEEMKYSYGNSENSWLGVEHMRRLTEVHDYILHAELTNFTHDDVHSADFFNFEVKGPDYALDVSSCHGPSGPNRLNPTMLALQNSAKFSTFDYDKDSSDSEHCAVKFMSAWWHTGCFYANLNGPYPAAGPNITYGMGITWRAYANDTAGLLTSWKTSLLLIRRPDPGFQHPRDVCFFPTETVEICN